MPTHVGKDGKIHEKEHGNIDVTQTYQKDNDDPPFEPVNDHQASPLDEPAPTDHNFDQAKEQKTAAKVGAKD